MKNNSTRFAMDLAEGQRREKSQESTSKAVPFQDLWFDDDGRDAPEVDGGVVVACGRSHTLTSEQKLCNSVSHSPLGVCVQSTFLSGCHQG